MRLDDGIEEPCTDDIVGLRTEREVIEDLRITMIVEDLIVNIDGDT